MKHIQLAGRYLLAGRHLLAGLCLLALSFSVHAEDVTYGDYTTPGFTDPDLIIIGGNLDLKDSLSQVLTTISDIVPIDYRISGNQVIVNQKINELNPRN